MYATDPLPYRFYTHRHQLNDKIKNISPESRRGFETDLKTWESALEDYRKLMSCESSVHRLREVDIPSLENQIHAQDGLLPSLARSAEKVWYLRSSERTYLT